MYAQQQPRITLEHRANIDRNEDMLPHAFIEESGMLLARVMTSRPTNKIGVNERALFNWLRQPNASVLVLQFHSSVGVTLALPAKVVRHHFMRAEFAHEYKGNKEYFNIPFSRFCDLPVVSKWKQNGDC